MAEDLIQGFSIHRKNSRSRALSTVSGLMNINRYESPFTFEHRDEARVTLSNVKLISANRDLEYSEKQLIGFTVRPRIRALVPDPVLRLKA